MLQQQFSELSSPLLAIEEPEAHLHPTATRSLWPILNAIPGQKIVASHSGDLVANAPLSSIRRLYTSNGDVKVGSVPEQFLTDGLGATFEAHISVQKRHMVTEKRGTAEYWRQVLKAADDSPKPAVIQEVVHEIEQGAKQQQMLIHVLDAALKLPGA
jgi:hypothetical protein